jgi:Methyltransferase domain
MNKLKSIVKTLFKPPVRRLKGDTFIERLPSAVVGAAMLHEGNPYLFDWAIRNLPATGAVLEIGSYGGLSTNLLIHLLQKYGKNHPFFTCDAWLYEGYSDHLGQMSEWMDGRNDVSRADFMAHIKSSFIHTTRLLSHDRLPYTIHTRSDAFLLDWNTCTTCTDVFGRVITLGGPIAFAYIDGDHSYATAMMEFERIHPHLVRGGMLLFDDSGRGMPFGSVQVAAAILLRTDYRLVAKNPNILVQKCE